LFAWTSLCPFGIANGLAQALSSAQGSHIIWATSTTQSAVPSPALFDFELVEGKDHPNELPPLMYVEFGKTGGLLLRLTKTIHGTGQYVILDSGFCVLKAIVGLRQHGVFSGALIKKRRY
jgi:hypothetical protein